MEAIGRLVKVGVNAKSVVLEIDFDHSDWLQRAS